MIQQSKKSRKKSGRIMDDLSKNKEYGSLIKNIEKFVEEKQEEPKIILGLITEINSQEKIITAEINQEEALPTSLIGSFVKIYDKKAAIIDIYGKTLKLEVEKDLTNLKLSEEIEIDLSLMNIILKRLQKTTEKIRENKVDQETERILNFIVGEGRPTYEKHKKKRPRKFNNSQAEAISYSLNANDFHIVAGPPGTGKTHVIAELAHLFFKEKQKTLITAWTNLAVDNMVEKLIKKTDKILRIGRESKINPKLKKYSLFAKMKKDVSWKYVVELVELINKSFDEIKQKRKEVAQCQDVIDKIQVERDRFKVEALKLAEEKVKYKETSFVEKTKYDSSKLDFLKEKAKKTEKKANIYLGLSKKVIELEKRKQSLHPSRFYQNLQKDLGEVKKQIIYKKIPSIFSTNQKNKRNELRKKYNEGKGLLEQYQEYVSSFDLCKEEFSKLCPKGSRTPDKKALDLQLDLLTLFNNDFLPLEKKRLKKEIEEEKQQATSEVYKRYLEYLDKETDLANGKIKCLNADMYVSINDKGRLKHQITNLRECIEKYRKSRDKLKREIISKIIQDANLIAATAIYSSHPYLDNVIFDYTIMDEASQVAGYLSLLSLTKCKRFILVGDNKQLQPIEELKVSKELNLSIFNRFVEKHKYPHTLLDTQYRMNKKIASIANNLFYDGKLKTFEGIANQTLKFKSGKPKNKLLGGNNPVVFIDTKKVGYYEDGTGTGCENQKEAKLVAHIASLLLDQGIKPNSIGILTPYRRQRSLIKKCVEESGKDIEVNTVYEYQGREKEVIIISFAKSSKSESPKYKLNFIERPTQLNVAITRAKKKLIIVGNSQTLCQSKLLKRLLDRIGTGNIVSLK